MSLHNYLRETLEDSDEEGAHHPQQQAEEPYQYGQDNHQYQPETGQQPYHHDQPEPEDDRGYGYYQGYYNDYPVYAPQYRGRSYYGGSNYGRNQHNSLLNELLRRL